MKSWVALAVVAILVPVGAMTFAAPGADTSTEDVMKGLFKKGSGKFNTVLKKQLDAKPVNWEDVQKTTKEIHELGEALGKNKPEKGSEESWKKLTGKFADDTKALNEAAEAKSTDKVKAAQKAIGGSCKSCHDAHRG